jgi:hypothetical protein
MPANGPDVSPIAASAHRRRSQVLGDSGHVVVAEAGRDGVFDDGPVESALRHRGTDLVGERQRQIEVLSGKRSISKDQAKKLASFFHVRADLFI